MPFYLADFDFRRIDPTDFDSPEDAIDYTKAHAFITEAQVVWED